jgi:hypothetical protein
MNKITNDIIATGVLALASCGTVDITKTGSGYYDPVPASTVEIIKTKPERSYVELATIDVGGFSPRDTAKMHNAIRSKAGPVGANAVLITDEGVVYQPYVGTVKYVSGVAIRYNKGR